MILERVERVSGALFPGYLRVQGTVCLAEGLPARRDPGPRPSIHRRVPWGPLGHGFDLGGCGLLLEPRYARLSIAASVDSRDPFAWGSHPVTDPLMSTALTRFHHHGAEHARFDKLRRIARHAPALRSLQVGYQQRDQTNCGRCEKCYRTMLALEILGVPPEAASLPRNAFSIDRLRRIHIPAKVIRDRYRELLECAGQQGRTDLCAAIEDCLRWNARVDRTAQRAGAIGRVPGLSRLGRACAVGARRFAIRHAIH